MKPGQLITVESASELLSIPPRAVRKLIKSRHIPAVRIGPTIRIDRVRLEEMVAEQIAACGTGKS